MDSAKPHIDLSNHDRYVAALLHTSARKNVRLEAGIIASYSVGMSNQDEATLAWVDLRSVHSVSIRVRHPYTCQRHLTLRYTDPPGRPVRMMFLASTGCEKETLIVLVTLPSVW